MRKQALLATLALYDCPVRLIVPEIIRPRPIAKLLLIVTDRSPRVGDSDSYPLSADRGH